MMLLKIPELKTQLRNKDIFANNFFFSVIIHYNDLLNVYIDFFVSFVVYFYSGFIYMT